MGATAEGTTAATSGATTGGGAVVSTARGEGAIPTTKFAFASASAVAVGNCVAIGG
eukprot:m.27855 g.27855  ORF g.27855 m.27855 type:complete len:56 (-) comp15821_c2_seq1:54-221(-)